MKPYTNPAVAPASTARGTATMGSTPDSDAPTHRRRESAHEQLALGTDVEQACPEAEADRQSGQDQGRGPDQGVDDAVAVRGQQRTLQQRAICLEGEGEVKGRR